MMPGLGERKGDEPRIERLTSDRLDQLVDFLVEEFGRERGASSPLAGVTGRARWRWSTVDYPIRPDGALPAWICLDGGRIVGHVGALPVEVVARGQARGMAWARDLIVARSARGLGIGPRLMAAVTRDAVRCGVLGYADTYNLYRRVGFLDMGAVPLFVKVRRARAFAAAFVPRRPLRELASLLAPLLRMRLPRPRRHAAVRPLARFDHEFDRWWRGAEPHLGCVIRRTSATMEWRYIKNPVRTYRVLAAREGPELRGIAVMRRGISRGLSVGILVELLTQPADTGAMLDLIAAAEDDLIGGPDGQDIAFFRANVLHPSFGQALVRAGYLRVPSPIRWIIAGAQGRRSLVDLLDRREWYLNGGDSDIDLL